MRIATIISLLFLSCAACALQPHTVERRDGFRSSVIRRRSSQPNSQRRLASRSIRPSIGPDIVPRHKPELGPIREIPKHQCSPFDSLQEILKVKEEGVITKFPNRPNMGVEVYRISCSFDELKPVVVKEIDLSHKQWSETKLEKEISRLMARGELHGALHTGRRCYIIMKDLGDPWKSREGTTGYPGLQHMVEADKWDEEKFGLKRSGAYQQNDYTWTGEGNSLVVRSVGRWRFAHFTGVQREPVEHYCGIIKWTKEGDSYFPIFTRLSSDGITVHTHSPTFTSVSLDRRTVHDNAAG